MPLLVLLASSQIAHGFATPKCKTDEFIGGIRETVQCDGPHVVDYVDKMLTLYNIALKSNAKVLDIVEACKKGEVHLLSGRHGDILQQRIRNTNQNQKNIWNIARILNNNNMN